MPKKKTSVPHCPNCGAPVRGIPAFSNMARCEYCDSYVDISDWLPKKAQAPQPTQEYRPAPPAVKPTAPPKVVYKPEDYIDYKKPKKDSKAVVFLIELAISALIVFTWPIWLRGCLMGF